jgi:josephin
VELHNNFFKYFLEKGEFTKEKLDAICTNLSPDQYINPHKSVLGLGNYDVNVLMVALESEGMDLTWFDRRKEITAGSLELGKIFGLILNIPSDYTFAFITLPIKSRHWICIKKMQDGKYYNLDSKLNSPKCIGAEDNFIKYLQEQMKSNDKELFLVLPKDSS